MKVSYAFRALSNTLAEALRIRQYPNIEETIRFIRKVNKFADASMGAPLMKHIVTEMKI